MFVVFVAERVDSRLTDNLALAVRSPDHFEKLIDAIDVCNHAFIGQHKVGYNLEFRSQRILDDVFLESNVIYVLPDSRVHGIGSLCELPVGSPRLGLHLDKVDDIALLFNNIRAHEAVSPAESRFSNIYILALKQFYRTLQRLFVSLKSGKVCIRLNVVVYLSQVSCLVTAIGQSLEEVILAVLVGIGLIVIIIV